MAAGFSVDIRSPTAENDAEAGGLVRSPEDGPCYPDVMINALKQMLPQIEAWPSEDQEALFEAARSIEAERKGVYRATESELTAIDRGLSEARSGRFAGAEAVRKVRAKFSDE
jgi:hypothetical protein